MILPHRICQACTKAQATSILENSTKGQPYYLCEGCAERLEKRALRPREWYNLASIHGWIQYELSDDFYDQDGTATASDSAFPVSRDPRALRLDEVAHDLDRLIGHCLTRWRIGDEEYDAVKRFDEDDVLKHIERLAVRDGFHWSVALELAANVLGPRAERFVRNQYDIVRRSKKLIGVWSEAAQACLPQSEGLDLTIAILGELPPRDLYDRLWALTTFRSRKTLGWIEENLPSSSIGANWGRLAAYSQLNWEDVVKWLERGRPFSLLALDALWHLMPKSSENPTYQLRAPRLADAPDSSVIRLALENYMASDDSPKAVTRCNFIIRNLETLRRE